MNIEGLSLDQLRTVLAVVDAGSFSAAARRFARAQSAVSYAVAQAEAQLGVDLFDRSGKRPQLTPAGRALLPEIRAIVSRADDLRARAAAVSAGVEPEIALAVDAVCAPAALAAVLAEFSNAYPVVPVRLHVETLGRVVERVLDGAAQLGVIATMTDLPQGLVRYTAAPIRMSAVASPGHPLAARDGDVAAVQEAVQIVLSDRSARTDGRDYAVLSPRTWRVDDLSAKRALIRAGVGWGSLPDWLIEEDLAEGRLVRLRVPGLPDKDDMASQLFHGAGRLPGPALAWLIKRLQRAPLD